MKIVKKRVKPLPLKQQKEDLDRCYKLVMSAGNDSPDLVVALHDYIECINNNPTIDHIVDSVIQKEPKDILKRLEILQKKAQPELDSAYDLIKKKLPKSLNPDTFLVSHFDDKYEDYKSGRVRSSMGLLESCANVLESIVQKLWREPVGIDVVRKYVTKTFKESNGAEHISEISISKNLTRYRELKNEFDSKDEIRPWGIFNKIYPSFLAIEVYTHNTKIIDELMLKDSYSPLFYSSAYESLLKEGDKPRGVRNFLVSHYSKFNLTRLHNSILSNVDSFEESHHSNQTSKFKNSSAKSISIDDKKIHTITILKPKKVGGLYQFIINNDGHKRTVRKSSHNVNTFLEHIVNGEDSMKYSEPIFKYLNDDKNNIFFGDGRYAHTKLAEHYGEKLIKSTSIEWKPMQEHNYQGVRTRQAKLKK